MTRTGSTPGGLEPGTGAGDKSRTGVVKGYIMQSFHGKALLRISGFIIRTISSHWRDSAQK